MGATKLKPAHAKLDLVPTAEGAAAAETDPATSQAITPGSAAVRRLSPRIPPRPASVPVGMQREYRDLMRQLLVSATWNPQQLPLVECYLLAMHAARHGESDALRLRARAQVLAYAQALGVATRSPQLLRGTPPPLPSHAPEAPAKAPASRWS